MERRTFEESLKDVFKDAEATPSDKVWTNVELELEKETGSSMRRRLVFYQMLAAAAVTLALLSSGVAYYIISTKNQTIEQLVAASQVNPSNNNGEANGQASGPASAQVVPEDAQSTAALRHLPGSKTNKRASKNQRSAGGASDTDHNSPGIAFESIPSATDQGGNNKRLPVATEASTSSETQTDAGSAYLTSTNLNRETAWSHRSLSAFFTATIHQPTLQRPEADPVAMMMSKLAEEEMKLSSNEEKKDDVSKEKTWTALGFAAGGFSAVNHNASPVQQMGFASSNNASVANKQAKANGVAYSMGVSFGTKVARRWVVHGGVNYLTQSSNYVATNVIAGPNYQTLQAESINALGKLPELADAAYASERLAPTVPYSVNNSLKFFSVPMQAGYLLVNRKFGVQLNAGISTDLFLQNTITPEGGSLDKTTQSSGSDSPYRTVNFSGLMGTEFSYRLGQRYRVALNPALRYPLNSVYKSDVGIDSTPLTFDIGLRFRYIFK
jgi:hypothetical protein